MHQMCVCRDIKHFVWRALKRLELHLFRALQTSRVFNLDKTCLQARGGGTWIIFGWVCAAQDSKLAPRSKKNIP